MKNIKLFYVALASIFMLASCSIEKRQYQSGYYINWYSGKKGSKIRQNNKENTSSVSVIPSDILSVNTIGTSQNQTPPITAMNTEVKQEPRLGFVSKKSLNSVLLPAPETQEQIIKVQTVNKVMTTKKGDSGLSKEMLYLIAVLGFLLVPFGTVIAVGLATDWDITKMLYNVLWYLLCLIPGLIHALIVVSKNAK